jgi:single-stranded-DNA-specific exonuclease
VRIAKDQLDNFRAKIHEYYKSLHLADQTNYFISQPDLTVDDFSDFTLEFMQDLKLLEPFGAGNEEPIFRLKDVSIRALRKMGADGQHLRIDLADKNGKPFKLVAFYAPEKWLNLDPEYSQIEPVIKLAENDFNGVRSVEARIIDINMV